MTAWFRYERDFARRWCPVVIYAGKPVSKEGASPAFEVPHDCLSPDGSPLFGKLKARFPAPENDEGDR